MVMVRIIFIQFPIILPSSDRKTNTAAENKLTIKVTAMNSGKVQQLLTLMTYRKHQVSHQQYGRMEAGQTITSCVRMKVAILEVKTTGGRHPYNITLTNDGGRSISRLDLHQYGVRTHTDDSVLTWTFKPKVDYTTNSGNETMLKVKLVSDVGNIDQGYTLANLR